MRGPGYGREDSVQFRLDRSAERHHHDAANDVLNQAAVARVWPFLADKPPVLVDWLSWNRVFGGSFCFDLTLFHGGTFYLDDGKPSPRLIDRSVTNLREISPTMCLNVPLGYDMLLPHVEGDATLRDRFFSQLDVLFYAAAVLPPALWRRLEDLAFQTRGEKVVAHGL